MFIDRQASGELYSMQIRRARCISVSEHRTAQGSRPVACRTEGTRQLHRYVMSMCLSWHPGPLILHVSHGLPAVLHRRISSAPDWSIGAVRARLQATKHEKFQAVCSQSSADMPSVKRKLFLSPGIPVRRSLRTADLVGVPNAAILRLSRPVLPHGIQAIPISERGQDDAFCTVALPHKHPKSFKA